MLDLLFTGWAVPILLSALGLGLYDVCKKDAVRDNSVMPALFFATLSGSCFFVLLTLCSGDLCKVAACDAATWWRLLGKSALVGSSGVCVYDAMRDLPISIAAPVRASSPVWTLVGGILLFGEVPTPVQAVGMALIFVGYYFFAVFGKTEGFSLKHHGMYLILLGTLLGACSALYDRYLLGTLGISRRTVQFWFSVDLVFLLGLGWLIRRMIGEKGRPFVWRWSIVATGILLIIADALYFYAAGNPDAQISILSLMRRSNCIVSFALGVWIFKDRNIKRKAVALLIILAGVALLALF